MGLGSDHTSGIDSGGASPRQLQGFAEELSALYREMLARVGPEDLAHVKRMRRISRGAEVLGRSAIHFSMDPFTFLVGVLALAVHKQLEWIEIGHFALHGVYDNLENANEFRSERFRWDLPIDEASWRESHNVRHHSATNVVGRDPDIELWGMRLCKNTPWTRQHGSQMPLLFGVVAPYFASVVNSHVTELSDEFLGRRTTRSAGEPSDSPWRRTVRKVVPYYFKECVFFPALAGPFFAKVLLGNLLAELGRDTYSVLTVMSGHVGETVQSWPDGARPRCRGEWFAMQIAATHNFEVNHVLSILCGANDRHIEHHLFPRLPPNRLREVAPRVREICERHSIKYSSQPWGQNIRSAVRELARLAKEPASA